MILERHNGLSANYIKTISIGQASTKHAYINRVFGRVWTILNRFLPSVKQLNLILVNEFCFEHSFDKLADKDQWYIDVSTNIKQ